MPFCQFQSFSDNLLQHAFQLSVDIFLLNFGFRCSSSKSLNILKGSFLILGFQCNDHPRNEFLLIAIRAVRSSLDSKGTLAANSLCTSLLVHPTPHNSMRQSAAVKHCYQESITKRSEARKIQTKLREWIELCHHIAIN